MDYFSKETNCSRSNVTIFEDVVVRNLHVDEATASAYEIVGLRVNGEPAMLPIRGVTLDNVTVAKYPRVGHCAYASVRSVGEVAPRVPAGERCARGAARRPGRIP